MIQPAYVSFKWAAEFKYLRNPLTKDRKKKTIHSYTMYKEETYSSIIAIQANKMKTYQFFHY